MLLALTLMLQDAAAAPNATAAPIALFQQACLGGELKAKRSDITAIGYADLPAEARALFGRASSGDASDTFHSPSAREVSNPVYSLDGGNVFLITATATPQARSHLAEMCAVIWRGDGFVAAERLFVPADPSTPPSAMSAEALREGHYSFAASNDGNSYLVAVGSGHWTALTAAPSSYAPPEFAVPIRKK